MHSAPALPELDTAWLQSLFDRFDAMAREAVQHPDPQEKADGTVVTRLDREVSAMVRDAVGRRYPESGLISEEEPEHYRADADWQWVLDPLDGTAAFARGFPVWGMGLGVMHRGEPRGGFLRFPVVNETFTCMDGTVTVNGEPWHPAPVNRVPDTENVLIGSGLQGVLPMDALRGIKLRNYGSSLYHLVCLGIGRAEAVINARCYLWDLVQALPFTRARGCVEVYCDGRPLSVKSILDATDDHFRVPEPFVVGEPHIVEQVLQRWR